MNTNKTLETLVVDIFRAYNDIWWLRENLSDYYRRRPELRDHRLYNNINRDLYDKSRLLEKYYRELDYVLSQMDDTHYSMLIIRNILDTQTYSNVRKMLGENVDVSGDAFDNAFMKIKEVLTEKIESSKVAGYLLCKCDVVNDDEPCDDVCKSKDTLVSDIDNVKQGLINLLQLISKNKYYIIRYSAYIWLVAIVLYVINNICK